MATIQYKGACSWSYTPYGVFTAVTLDLAIPLWDVQLVDLRKRHDWWAADFNTREIVNIGGGVRDILATVRLESEPTAFKDMLREALTYDTILYYTQAGVVYPLRLVAIVNSSDQDATMIIGDRDRLGFGEWEARLQLRRTDGGTLDGIIT